MNITKITNFSLIQSKFNFVYFAVTGIFLLLVYFRSSEALSSWKYTLWLFSYEYGFIKRGLVGELLRFSNITPSYETITIISIALVLIVFLLLIFVFSRPITKTDNHLGLFLFFLVAITSPATLQSFNYDIGRFDSLGLFFMFGALFSITRFPTSVSYWVVPILLILSILIHEASFFMFVPFTLFYWYYVDSSSSRIIPKLIVFIVILLATYLISTHGVLEKKTVNEYYSSLNVVYGESVSESSLNVLHRGSLTDVTAWTIPGGLTKRIYEHIIMFIGLMPTFALFVWLIFKTSILKSFQSIGLLCAAFSPLLLYPLGHDHFRWWSIAITNVFIFFSLISSTETKIRTEINSAMLRIKWLVAFIIFIGLVLGPLLITSSFRIPGLDFRSIFDQLYFLHY